MKQRFGHEEDQDSPHQIHDYITYSAHEKTLMERYEANKEQIIREVEKLLPDLELDGQWSLDIMQNGDDFYLIDMALADNSALSDCVPKGMLKKTEENWIPKLDSDNPEIYVSPEDICVCCGRPVPEGTMLCWTCTERAKKEP